MTGEPLVVADEQAHPFDPAVWSWNESWFSFIDLAGGPAGFFRLGALPNQGRAPAPAPAATSASLRLEVDGAPPVEATRRPIAPSIAFDVAHTAEVAERWLYWRTLWRPT